VGEGNPRDPDLEKTKYDAGVYEAAGRRPPRTNKKQKKGRERRPAKQDVLPSFPESWEEGEGA
jgi:hypothetical protein